MDLSKYDFIIKNEGTIIVFSAQTDKAKQWLDENVHTEPWQWMGDRLCVDHRPARDLFYILRDSGFDIWVS